MSNDAVMTASKAYEESDKGNILAKDTNRSEFRHIKFREYLLSFAP